MKHIRNEIDPLHELDGRQLEEGKALAVISLSVDPAPEEILLIVQEIEGDPIPDQLSDPDILMAPAHIGIVVSLIGDLIAEPGIHQVIIGKNDNDLIPLFRQSLGKGSNHIPQATRLGKRRPFRRCKHNFH